MIKNKIEIYTDGSCNTKTKNGAWAAIILLGDRQETISGKATNTTNNRMELTAVIKSLEYVVHNKLTDETIQIYTDSQYVEKIPQRVNNLELTNYITKKGRELPNAELVKYFTSLLKELKVNLIKVKAHQKSGNTANYNREADMLCRNLVRNSS